MEDVLEVYHRRFDDQEVLVCLDETSKQLVQETRQPRPPQPGAAMAYDYEYRRKGVSNRFMLFAPLEGWRRVEVTDRRTRTDWAEVVRKLVDEDYPDKERIVLVMDNLNTHHPLSLYEAFEPAEALRIAKRLEIHYTPKHGSWLNIAEIELGCWRASAWIAGFPARKSWNRKQERGRSEGTGRRLAWTGASPPGTPASGLSPYTHQYNSDGLLGMRPQIWQAGRSDKSTLHTGLVTRIISGLSENADINWEQAIDTRSNLNSETLNEILCAVGLDNGYYMLKKPIIDEKLLANRNAIAHGERRPEFEADDYATLHDDIIQLVERFRPDIENAAATNSYLRNLAQ